MIADDFTDAPTPRPTAADGGGEPGSFGAILRGVRSLIHPALLDAPGWTRVLACAGDLPPDAARTFGFEFRLGDPVPAADFSVFVRPHSAIERYYIRRGEAAGPGSREAALARSMLAAREKPEGGRPWRTILEYDLVGAPPEGPWEPGIYLVQPELDTETTADAGAGEDPQCIAAETARSAGWTEDRHEQRAMKRVGDALPPGGRIAITGAFPGRGVRALKVQVKGVPQENLPDFLTRAGWRGPVGAAADTLAVLRKLVDFFAIALDITGGGPRPRLGLEFYPAQDSDAWKRVIARLLEKGWCLPAKADGVLAWPGRETLYGAEGVFAALQVLAHVKLVIDENGAVQAKAYTDMSVVPAQP